ncbi:MAG: single-stranded DNA-binding protein [Candidatus Gracilibacteria bacterium]|jgi:single-strand DNA-binding protein
MAFSLNRAQIIGNVTRDPEVRQTSGGQSVASFAVATNSTWVDKMGQKQEKAEFHNVVAWGKLAEICQAYVKKGRKLYVEGRMQTRDWDGEDGVKRYRSEIVAENLILLDRSGAPESGVTYDRESNSSAVKGQQDDSAVVASAPVEEEVSLDDLPF